MKPARRGESKAVPDWKEDGEEEEGEDRHQDEWERRRSPSPERPAGALYSAR
jgi:hypothetical protein